MGSLSDMEELLLRIPNSYIADYMREALQCYNSGAYRGCIVLSSIAFFDDCLNKLADIRNFNKTAKIIHNEVLKRQNTQDVYECYLLDQLASNKLISQLDATTADLIRTRRNKSAHASGHKPSAEEARYVYYEVIDKFLSRTSFNSKVLADEIIDRLINSRFFPSTTLDDVKSIVGHEIQLLHSESFPYFFAKLIDGVLEKNRSFSSNAKYFINGLCALDNDKWNLLIESKLLEKKLDDEKYQSCCLAALSINPKIISTLSPPTLERLKAALKQNIDEIPNSSSDNSPAQFFENLLIKNPTAIKSLRDECCYFLNAHSYLSLSPLLANSDDNLWEQYQSILKKKACSTTFDVANNFAKQFHAIEDTVVTDSDGWYLLDLMLAIVHASKWGAWAAQSVVLDRFENFPKLKSAVMEHLEKEPELCCVKIKEQGIEIKDIDAFISQYIIGEGSPEQSTE